MTSSRTAAPLLLVVAALLVILLAPTGAWAADVLVTAQGVDPDPVVAQIDEAVSFTNGTDDVIRLVDDSGRWDSGDLAPGDVFTITFDVDGTYGFTSEDGAVTGTVQVGDPEADPTPTPEPTPTSEPTPDELPDALADTGLPSASLAWAAALCTLAGILVLRRTGGRP